MLSNLISGIYFDSMCQDDRYLMIYTRTKFILFYILVYRTASHMQDVSQYLTARKRTFNPYSKRYCVVKNLDRNLVSKKCVPNHYTGRFYKSTFLLGWRSKAVNTSVKDEFPDIKSCWMILVPGRRRLYV